MHQSNPLKERLRRNLYDLETTGGRLTDFFLLAVNLLACGLYVRVTYHTQESLPGHLLALETLIVAVFSADYLLRLWLSEHKWRFVFSFYSLVDLLSILPVFFQDWSTGFLRALRVLRILRFTRFLETRSFFFGKLSSLQLQVLRVAFTIITIIFISAGLVHYAEAGRPGARVLTFGDALYFAVVTLSTVGFGDITPVTGLGRLFTTLLIGSALVLVPWQAGRLVQLLLSSGQTRTERPCPSCGLVSHERDAVYCRVCGALLEPHKSMD